MPPVSDLRSWSFRRATGERKSLRSLSSQPRFCPACNHKSLLTSLTDKLGELDVLLKKTEAERRRKERLAFVNKSLSKALPTSPKKAAVRKVWTCSCH